MPFNEHQTGLAILVTGDTAQAARTASSLDLCRGAGFIEHRLLVCRGDWLSTPPPGWQVINVPVSDDTDLKTVALCHSQNCLWLAYAEGNGAALEKDFVADLVTRVQKKESGAGLVRVQPATAARPLPLPLKHPERRAAMLAVTVVTPAYAALAEEACRRVREFTGLEVLRIEVEEGRGFEAKLKLPALCPARRILFFDADWWLLRAVDVTAIEGDFCAVPDPSTVDPGSFCHQDSQALGLEAARYFNSGFFIADLACEDVVGAFARALEHFRAGKVDGTTTLTDTTDQSWLVEAIALKEKDCGIDHARLPLAWNYYHRATQWGCVKSIPPHLYAIHAAGVPLEEKQAHLQAMAAVFSVGVTKTPPPAKAAGVCTKTAAGWLANPKQEWGAFFAPSGNDHVSTAVKIEVARALLADRNASPQHWKTRANAKCYLTYRLLDGALAAGVYDEEVSAAVVNYDHEDDMAVRWEISQDTADIYVLLTAGRWEDASRRSMNLLRRVWAGGYLRRWQPMLCNVLRVMSLMCYLHYLRGQDNAARDLVGGMVELFQTETAAHQWRRWPLRFEEARSDLHALVNTMFIARALDMTAFPDHAWLDRAGRNRDVRTHCAMYRKLMLTMGARINPERDLFT